MEEQKNVEQMDGQVVETKDAMEAYARFWKTLHEATNEVLQVLPPTFVQPAIATLANEVSTLANQQLQQEIAKLEG